MYTGGSEVTQTKKIWEDVQSSCSRNADKVNHYYHRSTIIGFLLSFDVQRTLSIPSACLSHRGCLPVGTRSGLTWAELRIYNPL